MPLIRLLAAVGAGVLCELGLQVLDELEQPRPTFLIWIVALGLTAGALLRHWTTVCVAPLAMWTTRALIWLLDGQPWSQWPDLLPWNLAATDLGITLYQPFALLAASALLGWATSTVRHARGPSPA